jgi:peptidoglycan/xylan/chitin deacetylase (PgdA/CDA1 family)
VAWVEALKRLPGSMRADAVDELASKLGVALPSKEIFQNMYLDWSDVRTLARQGLEFGSHTHTHPILTKVDLSTATEEIHCSIEHLTSAFGSKPLAFAYPNGSSNDYSSAHEAVVHRCGVRLAFSLEPGPVPLSQVRRRPMAIGRIYIGQRDRPFRFAAKLFGAARLASAAPWSRRVL